jgi:hypothetical protein
MNPTDRQRQHRRKLSAAGLTKITVTVPYDLVDGIRGQALALTTAHKARALAGDLGEPIRAAVLALSTRTDSTSADKPAPTGDTNEHH